MESGVVSIKQNGKVVDRSGGKRFGKGRKWERQGRRRAAVFIVLIPSSESALVTIHPLPLPGHSLQDTPMRRLALEDD